MAPGPGCGWHRDSHTPGLGHGHSALSLLLHFRKGGTAACGIGEEGTPVMSEASHIPNPGLMVHTRHWSIPR